MTLFSYRNHQLHVEQCSVTELVEKWGSPLYLYSQQTIIDAYHAFEHALHPLSHRICYAVKANHNLSILKLLASLGAYFDIVSGGELARLQTAGIAPNRILFAGVGKTEQEIAQALKLGIHCFNVESEAELNCLIRIAQHLQCQAPFTLRINPDVDAQTHPHMITGLKDNKFGISLPQALTLYRTAAQSPHLKILGVSCHIGSQITTLTPYQSALTVLLDFINQLSQQNITLQHIDLGGGFGIPYRPSDQVPSIPEFMSAIKAQLSRSPYTVYLEPGRSLVGAAGALATRCLYTKSTPTKQFAIVDTGMHHLLRPALYTAYHPILPVTAPQDTAVMPYDIVGPICETADVLASARELPSLSPGDLLLIMQAGAYGMVMSSHYNSHPRPAEVLVTGKQARLIRLRENIHDAFAHELGLE